MKRILALVVFIAICLTGCSSGDYVSKRDYDELVTRVETLEESLKNSNSVSNVDESTNASSDNDDREIAMKFEDGTEIDRGSGYEKQKVEKKIFTCEKAGTYYLYNVSGGMYLHGLVIAKKK